MKKVLIKLLTSILIVMILFQFMVIEKTNIVQATNTYQEDDEAVEQERNAIEDDRSLGSKILDGFLSLILSPIKLLLVAPRTNFKWNYNSIRNYGRK